jgi:hypothetical protein
MPAPAQDSIVLFLREKLHLQDKGIQLGWQILNQKTNYEGQAFLLNQLTVSLDSICYDGSRMFLCNVGCPYKSTQCLQCIWDR